MDTVMLLTVYGDQAQQGLDQAEQTIQKLEKLWSATDETSEIWALNHSGGNWVELSEDTREILSRGLELCALTDGALDLTACSAVQAWGFPTGAYRVPDEAELEQLVSTGLTIATALVSWWKNNSFTPEAIEADDFLCQLKEHR